MLSTDAFRRDIQSLRGIAVALVLAFHAWPQFLPGGFVGVDVFFVISGYLITGLLVREQLTHGRISLVSFYARRARRLLPAACLVIATTALVFALTRSVFEARALVPSAVAAALYVSNLRFALRSVDYLAEGAQNDPLLHTWSLAVEEQFYLLWPLALLLLARWLPVRRAVCVLVVLGGTASLLAAIALTPKLQSWAFFGVPTRAWEFCAGAGAALLWPRMQGLAPAWRAALVVLGLGLVLASAALLSGGAGFPGPAAMWPVAGAFLLVLAGGDGLPAWLRRPLQARGLQALGDRSYALYLWHWPVLILAADLWPTVSPVLRGAAGIAVSLLLAQASYVWVENPLRRDPRLRARPGMSLFAGLGLGMLTAVLAVAAPGLAPMGRDLAARGKAEFAIRDRPRLYEDRCFASVLVEEPPPCVYGSEDGRAPSVVLFGDSHAAQWLPALDELGRAQGFRVAVFVKAACPVARVEPFDPKLGRPYTECTRWRETVLARIEALRPALVLAGNASSYQAFAGSQADADAAAAWRGALQATLLRLTAAAGHVLLLRDTPRPNSHVPRCLARAAAARLDPLQACAFSAETPPAERAFAVEREAVAATPRVTLADLGAEVCPRSPCPVEQQGFVSFHDAEHLSASLARALAPALWRQLPPAVQAAVVTGGGG